MKVKTPKSNRNSLQIEPNGQRRSVCFCFRFVGRVLPSLASSVRVQARHPAALDTNVPLLLGLPQVGRGFCGYTPKLSWEHCGCDFAFVVF